MSAPTGLVLLVEDDDDLRETEALLLRQSGYSVAEACHGREALELLRAGLVPSLILLDLAMPIMNGWELLARLEEDPALRDHPVVVISGSLEHARLPEGVCCLRKPIDAAALLELVAAMVAATKHGRYASTSA